MNGKESQSKEKNRKELSQMSQQPDVVDITEGQEDQNGEQKSPIKPIAAETRLIIAMLKPLEQGADVSYSDISAKIGKDVQQNRHFLASAIRFLQRQEDHIWRTVQNVGIHRCTDAEAVDLIEHETGLSLRRLDRTRSKSLCIDYDVLENTDRSRLLSEVAVTSICKQFRKKNTKQRLLEQLPVSDRMYIPCHTEILKLFAVNGERSNA